MTEKIKVLELFGGIGACSKALERIGVPYEIADYVEIDKHAVASFNAIHGTNFLPQDITKWDKDIPVDLIMHGSPCQDFSVAGKQAGGDEGSGTRSSLMYETLRIVEKLKPHYVIWENVKNLLSKKHRHNFDAYLEAMEKLGYRNFYQVLNAKNYGIPQNRERVFTVSIREREREYEFPQPFPLERKLKDMLEDAVDERYFLSDKTVDNLLAANEIQKKRGNGFKFEPRNPQGYATCVSTRAGSRRTDNYIQEGTITSVQKDNLVAEPQITMGGVAIKTANKVGYDMATYGDGVDLAYPNSTTRRGRVGHGVAKTLACQDTMGVVEYKTKNQRIIDTAEKSGFRQGETAYLDVYNGAPRTDITSTINAGTDSHQNNIIAHQYRIRKLTPKECWRLMGFDDADFEKAEKVNSNAQLYKQAGNSIVVNVLEGILGNLVK